MNQDKDTDNCKPSPVCADTTTSTAEQQDRNRQQQAAGHHQPHHFGIVIRMVHVYSFKELIIRWLLFLNAGIVHPDHVGSEYPGDNCNQYGAPDKAPECQPGKAGQCFKEGVVQFNAALASQGEVSAS